MNVQLMLLLDHVAFFQTDGYLVDALVMGPGVHHAVVDTAAGRLASAPARLAVTISAYACLVSHCYFINLLIY